MKRGRLGILDRPIAFQRAFVELTGNIDAALLLSQAYYWALRSEGGRFWKTMLQWQEEVGLSRHEQDHARKILKTFPFWKEETRKIEHRVWYTLDPQAVLDAVDRALSMPESGNDVAEKGESTLPESGNPSTSETTAETTGEVPPLTMPSLRSARPPRGAMVATSAKERPPVAHGHRANKSSKDLQQARERVGKSQEWHAFGLERTGIGCDLFRTQWRLHFAKHANNGQPLARVITVFLKECACLRLMVPPAFVRAAEDRCGIKVTDVHGEAKPQIGICTA
jgi:hypothetical protein